MQKVLVLCTLYFSLQLICTFQVVSQSPIYRFEHLTTADGLPSTAIYSLLQDSYGFMWIATRNGLCRYDGNEIKVYQYDPGDSTSISGNFLQSRLLEDDEGNIWVGTLTNGLNRFNRKTETFTRFVHNPDDSTSLSYNSVWTIFQDSDGIIWIGTNGRDYSPGGRGINRYNKITNNFTAFYPEPSDPESERNRINIINEDDGLLWVGTRNGMFTFDRNDHWFTLFDPIYEDFERFSKMVFASMTIDGDSLYWIGTNEGLFKYDKAGNRLKKIPTGEAEPYQLGGIEFRNQLILDPYEKDQIFWVGSNWGLHKYNPATGAVTSFLTKDNDPEGIISNFISDVVLDNTGKLWASSYPGINIINLKSINYKNYNIVFPGDDNRYSATSFAEDSDGYLWIGTTYAGLVKYDSMMNPVAHYPEFTVYDSNYMHTNVRELLIDSQDNIWIGCSGSGLHILDRESDRVIPCKFDEVSPHPPLVVTELFEDHNKGIWVGTRIGLFIRQANQQDPLAFAYAPFGEVSKYRIESIYEDSRNRLWIGTFGDGLICIPIFENNPDSMVFYQHEPGDLNSISSNEVLDVSEDKDGQVWFGTSRGVCRFNDTTYDFERISLKNDINVDLIYRLLCDNNGDFWTPSERGLIRFDPRGKKKTKLFTKSDGTPQELINYFNIYQDKWGEIYVGSMIRSGKGFYKFYPDSIIENDHIPPILITDFQVGNKPFSLDSSISFIQNISLNHRQNFFSFEFTALDLTDPEMNQYAYFLEGFDEDWIHSGNRRFANYTGVPPGSYTFRVKGSNNDGYWNEKGTNIQISISPPFWKTWWAYAFYGLLLISVLYGWRRYDLKRQQLKQDLELEQIQTEKLEELDRMKSRFFANISHEFRTPLTLILGPLEGLLKRSKNNKTKQDLGIMQRNAYRLQRLINQLLNLSKLESGKMKLKAIEMDIVPLVRGYVQSFESLAKQNGIDLRFSTEEPSCLVYIDQDKIEKILFNLLSNAFKFSGSDGRIEVAVYRSAGLQGYRSSGTRQPANPLTRQPDKANEYLRIQISDTGPGISSEKLPHIFDRFYQADESFTKDGEGSGIGLALTKELVALHHGEIEVKSEVGKGSVFWVYLPLGCEHLSPEELDASLQFTVGSLQEGLDDTSQVDSRQSHIASQIGNDDMMDNRAPCSVPRAPESNEPIILLVEDNADLRLYIRGYLETYTVIEAKDGKQGLERALENIPDLIISDVMMPEMDGFELCGRLKTDQRTSHIPVILLTARAGMESKIEGLETGADDFITKPFDPLELQTRVRNLIHQRQILREAFGSEVKKGALSLIRNIPLTGLTEMDQTFIKKAYDVVEKNLSDTEFNVEVFGQEMAISRVHLHRKLKALINHTASEFIRTLRLNRAAEMLKRKSATVSEIAYDVGFSTVPYFTKCFQEQFGMTPTTFSKKHA